MKYIAYYRVSTKGQETSGLGLDAQRKMVKDYIKSKDPKSKYEEWVETVTGRDVKEEIISEAEAFKKREVLMNAVASVEKGDIFIVATRDRVARDPYLIAMIERLVRRRKGIFIAVKSDNGNDPGAILLRQIIDAFAMYEGIMISVRTINALQRKKAKGERAGAIPYGKHTQDGCKLLPEASEVLVIKRMRELRKQGLSFRQIAEVLNNEGYTKRSGAKWDQSAVFRYWENDV